MIESRKVYDKVRGPIKSAESAPGAPRKLNGVCCEEGQAAAQIYVSIVQQCPDRAKKKHLNQHCTFISFARAMHKGEHNYRRLDWMMHTHTHKLLPACQSTKTTKKLFQVTPFSRSDNSFAWNFAVVVWQAQQRIQKTDWVSSPQWMQLASWNDYNEIKTSTTPQRINFAELSPPKMSGVPVQGKTMLAEWCEKETLQFAKMYKTKKSRTSSPPSPLYSSNRHASRLLTNSSIMHHHSTTGPHWHISFSCKTIFTWKVLWKKWSKCSAEVHQLRITGRSHWIVNAFWNVSLNSIKCWTCKALHCVMSTELAYINPM